MKYEYIERVQRGPKKDCDGVFIIPILVSKKKNLRQLLLISCYRPPVDAYLLEFPAGLMESDDNEKDALRELKEETGYTASKFIKVSNIIE